MRLLFSALLPLQGRVEGWRLRALRTLLDVPQPGQEVLHPTQRVSLLRQRRRPQQVVQQQRPHQDRDELVSRHRSADRDPYHRFLVAIGHVGNTSSGKTSSATNFSSFIINRFESFNSNNASSTFLIEPLNEIKLVPKLSTERSANEPEANSLKNKVLELQRQS